MGPLRERADLLRHLADEHLQAARLAAAEGLLNAAFGEARTAAELTAKALLERRNGHHPRYHNPTRHLAQHRLVPAGLKTGELEGFLDQWTRAAYHVDRDVEPREARRALELAQRLLDAYESGLGRKP